jgi:hydrogenase expression/formation protein HypE
MEPTKMNPDHILLDHSSGGRVTNNLVSECLLPWLGNGAAVSLHDGAVLTVGGQRLAFSTDSYVVTPIFFPGGHIGDLAVNGTVNDIAMCGATPLYLSAGLIIEEGLPLADLKAIVTGMGAAAQRAGVTLVTGDTKVVPRGAADRIYINTSGIGIIADGIDIRGDRARPGDKVILSGTMADHGMTILTQREGLHFQSDMRSDTAPLNHLVARMLTVCPDIHVLRDPTRGGVATALNEIAEQSGVAIALDEADLPVADAVAAACELIGFDPLHVANEGKLLAIVPEASAQRLLSAMKEMPVAEKACIIGSVTADRPARVTLRTRIGGTRLVDMLTGEQLPRIC